MAENQFTNMINSYYEVQTRLEPYLNLVSEHINKLGSCDTILESGAGREILSLELLKNGKTVHAIDLKEEGLNMLMEDAQEQGLDYKLRCYTTDAQQLSQDMFPDEFYDGVSSMLVLPLIKDTERYFREHYRVTKNGGTFVVSGPPENPGDLSKSIKWWGEILSERNDFQKIERHWACVKESIDKNRKKLCNLYSVKIY